MTDAIVPSTPPYSVLMAPFSRHRSHCVDEADGRTIGLDAAAAGAGVELMLAEVMARSGGEIESCITNGAHGENDQRGSFMHSGSALCIYPRSMIALASLLYAD